MPWSVRSFRLLVMLLLVSLIILFQLLPAPLQVLPVRLTQLHKLSKVEVLLAARRLLTRLMLQVERLLVKLPVPTIAAVPRAPLVILPVVVKGGPL